MGNEIFKNKEALKEILNKKGYSNILNGFDSTALDNSFSFLKEIQKIIQTSKVPELNEKKIGFFRQKNEAFALVGMARKLGFKNIYSESPEVDILIKKINIKIEKNANFIDCEDNFSKNINDFDLIICTSSVADKFTDSFIVFLGEMDGALLEMIKNGKKVIWINKNKSIFETKYINKNTFLSNLTPKKIKIKAEKEISEEELVKNMQSGKTMNYKDLKIFIKKIKEFSSNKTFASMLPIDKIIGPVNGFSNIIDSMTKKERIMPELVKKESVQKRIQKGAGVNTQTVATLVTFLDFFNSNFKEKMKNPAAMMDQLSKLKNMGGLDLEKLGGLGNFDMNKLKEIGDLLKK